jgi:glycogen operon protein
LPIKGIGLEDIAWFLPDGSEMTEEHWNVDFAKSMAIFLNGQGIHSVGPKGEHVVDDSFYVIFNAYHEAISFKLPTRRYGISWIKELDTNEMEFEPTTFAARESIKVEGRSIMVLRAKVKEQVGAERKTPKVLVKKEV